jgi:hypothetical protein
VLAKNSTAKPVSLPLPDAPHRLRLEIAIHEAGHAVIARVLGLRCGKAVITGRDGFAHWKADGGGIMHVIALLAGRAASDVILGRTTESGCAGDDAKVMKLIEADGFRERFFAFDLRRESLSAKRIHGGPRAAAPVRVTDAGRQALAEHDPAQHWSRAV